MPDPNNAGPIIRFDPFEADLRSGELRKRGVKVKVGDQPFSILAILLSAPGQVITRDEIQKRLWPADTFVDFERGLNKAINRLRDALGDSAESPSFIETLPKRGYRFIGSIDPSSPTGDPERVGSEPETVQSEPLPPSAAPRIKQASVVAAGASVLLLLVVTAAWWLASRGVGEEAVGPIIRSSVLPPSHTSFVPSGFSLSQDGTRLAFVAETGEGSRMLWIRGMATTTATAVAGTDGASLPFWSPDQRRVGFFADRKLKVVEVGSGAIQVLADAPRASGGTWGAADVTLYAQPFDSSGVRITGPPIPITGREVAIPPTLYPSGFSVSMNGVLAFQSTADLPSELVWLDAQGREQTSLPGIKYTGPTISPDGRLLTGTCEGPRNGMRSICVFDFMRGVTARVTEGPNDRYPAWSRDGREIAYTSEGAIYRVPADGSARPEQVSRRGIPTSWLPDRRILSFGSQHSVVSMALSSPATHEVSELGPGAEGQLSPNADWLAYVAEAGIVVQRFPEPSARIIITGDRAAQPRWSRNGRQIFYISADKKLMAADFDSVAVTASAPRILAQTRIVGAALTGFQYDVAPDGRFIVNALTKDAAPLTLMTGWGSKLQ